MSTLDERREQFAREAAAFTFKFRCDDCSHVILSTRLCSLGMPNLALRDNPSAFTATGDYAFCKYFEVR